MLVEVTLISGWTQAARRRPLSRVEGSSTRAAESRRGECKRVHPPRTPAVLWLLVCAAVDQGRLRLRGSRMGGGGTVCPDGHGSLLILPISAGGLCLTVGLFGWTCVSVRGRFRASKSAESRRGECKKVHSPRTPAGPWLLGRAAVDQGRRSVAEDCFEFPLSAEAILRKVAASVPLGCAAAAWSLMGRPVPTDMVPSLSRRSPQEAAA